MVTYSYRARDVSLPKDIPSACHPVLLRWPLGSRFSAGAELCLALFQGHLWEPARRGMILSSCWGRQAGDLDCVCVCEREKHPSHLFPGPPFSSFPAGALGQPEGCWPGPLRQPCTWEMLFTASPRSLAYLGGQERPSDPRPAVRPAGFS